MLSCSCCPSEVVCSVIYRQGSKAMQAASVRLQLYIMLLQCISGQVCGVDGMVLKA
jgi:hypothetical protein